jgi:ADP-L-glycero-D-manno-heptose 6-epimerase
MILVTGGAGFIGSNLVRGLNDRGNTDILIVDNLENSVKFRNLVGCQFADYIDKRAFRALLDDGAFEVPLSAIFHQGACTDTMEYDGRYMMDNNYTVSKGLLHYALENEIPFIYASSAAVYGTAEAFSEDPANERPANIYGYSKLVFDQYVRRLIGEITSPVVGLRYFNVYGPREAHKGNMASVVFKFYQQLKAEGVIRLFEGTGGFGDGEQRRDFVFVEDVVRVNLFFLDSPTVGVFNVGTGQSRSFNAIARTLIQLQGSGEIAYIPFPPGLRGRYQSYTKADLAALRAAGYKDAFEPLEQGVSRYYDYLEQGEGRIA